MLTDNILSLYRSSSFASFAEGIGWYDDAHAFAASLDDNVLRAAGIIAALSPLNSWNNNKAKAANFYANGGRVKWDGTSNGYGLSSNVRKAERIWNGEDPLDVVTANKTRNFMLTIADPTREDHIPVIDRHAHDIALGRITSDDERAILSRKGEYARFATAYCDAASMAGIPVQSLQAITWVEWRDRIGKSWGG